MGCCPCCGEAASYRSTYSVVPTNAYSGPSRLSMEQSASPTYSMPVVYAMPTRADEPSIAAPPLPPSSIPRFLLTFPHASCKSAGTVRSSSHPCDTLADKAAEAMHQALPGSVMYVYPKQSRVGGHDLNRFETSDTEWRRGLDLAPTEGFAGILDIHSFPAYMEDLDYYTIAQSPFTSFDTFTTEWAYKRLAPRNIRGEPRPRTGGENAIMIQTRRWTGNTLLIEFSEGLSDKAVAAICQAFADAIRAFFSRESK